MTKTVEEKIGNAYTVRIVYPKPDRSPIPRQKHKPSSGVDQLLHNRFAPRTTTSEMAASAEPGGGAQPPVCSSRTDCCRARTEMRIVAGRVENNQRVACADRCVSNTDSVNAEETQERQLCPPQLIISITRQFNLMIAFEIMFCARRQSIMWEAPFDDMSAVTPLQTEDNSISSLNRGRECEKCRDWRHAAGGKGDRDREERQTDRRKDNGRSRIKSDSSFRSETKSRSQSARH
jgi:hypothetical protein